MKILFRFLLCSSFAISLYGTLIPPVVPGEPLYAIATELVSGINLLGFDISQIEFNLENLSASNLEAAASLIDVIIDAASEADVIMQQTLATASALDSALEGLSTALSQVEGIEQGISIADSLTDTITSGLNNANSLTQELVSVIDAVPLSQLEVANSELEVVISNASVAEQLTLDIIADLSELDSLLDALSGISSQINVIETGLNAINSTTDNINSNLDTVNSSLEVVLSISDQIVENVSAIEPLLSNIDTLSSTVDSVASTNEVIISTVDGIASGINILIVDNTTILSNLTTVTTTLSAGGTIYDMISQTDSNVAVLIANNSTIFSDLATIISDIDALSFSAINFGPLISDIDELGSNLESIIESLVDQLKDIPDFIETPTGFSPTSIQSNTSSYFFQSATLSPSSTSPVPIMSLENTGSRVVRISALGGGVVQNPNGIFGAVNFYKGSSLTGASFSPVDSVHSVIYKDTSATAFSGGTQVFQVANVFSASGGASTLPLTFIPKESYSILILPGETFTAAVTGLGTGATFQVMVLWEEIIIA